MPLEASTTGAAVRRLVNGLGSTQLLMGSKAGQRVRQAIRASMHLDEPVRFLARSIVSPARLGTYTVPAHTPSGRPLVVMLRHRTDDVLVFNEIFHHGIYRMPEAVRQVVARVSTPRVVDLGANIGLFSLWITSELSAATAVAVEPDPANFDCLERQIAANALHGRVEAIRAAAGASAGTVAFSAGNYIVSGVVPEGTGGAIRVAQRDALPILAGADLAKVDIEGSEWEILSDPRFATAGVRTLVMEWHATAAHPAGEAGRDARTLLDRAGFEIVETVSEAPTCGVLWAVSRRELGSQAG